MSNLPLSLETSLSNHPTVKGPVTTGRLRRTAASYLGLIVIGTVLLVLVPSPGWQAFGVGLWYPGAGFLAAGGWAIVLFPIFVILFVLSLIAWFGSGFTTLPPIVWAGGAALAGALASNTLWTPGVVVGVAVLVIGVVVGVIRSRKSKSEVRTRREQRLEYLPRVIAEARRKAVPAPAPGDPSFELDVEALASLRYVFDRALQPVGKFAGYDKIDQFQTASYRYQINYLGYGLSVMQAHYTPNFHGYSTEAQRRLIETYLDHQVWGYWALENAWGNLRINGDPVGKDNIMLTGFYGLQVGLYTALTGDDRYQQPGGLTFSKKGKPVHPHDLHDIADSLVMNFRKNPFGLYPCEPNWTYTACNFRGMGALQVYDRINGTSHFAELADRFRRGLETEFVNPDFGMVALKSKHTGIDLPFPLPDAVLAVYLNSMFPDIAMRYWAIVREEYFTTSEGRLKPVLPTPAIDMGNYKPGYGLAMESLYGAAREFGDHEAAEAAMLALEELCEPTTQSGVRYYRKMSNAVNACVALDRLLQHDLWRETVIRPTPESALRGPILSDVRYPDVLVARAVSSGEDLDLVLYPGLSSGQHDITLERLVPEGHYRIASIEQRFVADSSGTAMLSIHLDGRTPVHIVPAAP